MAIDWRTVIVAVPWHELIRNAPRIAEGARKLWGTARTRTPSEARDEVLAAVPVSPSDPDAIIKLQARIAATEGMVSELHGQIVASARLITDLADQNTQLIRQTAVQKRQIRWLAGASLVLFALSATSLWLAW